MDEKIIFRGFYENKNGTKTITINGAQIKGEWAYWNVFGTLTNSDGEEQIYEKRMGNGILRKYNKAEQLPIYEETIGQYSGETDMIGVKIFKDDIIVGPMGIIDFVVFDCGCFCMQKQLYHYEFTYQPFYSIKVIGNLWETPELIKE